MAQQIYFEPFFFRQELKERKKQAKTQAFQDLFTQMANVAMGYQKSKEEGAQKKLAILSDVVKQYGGAAGKPVMNAYADAIDTVAGSKVAPRDERGDALPPPMSLTQQTDAYIKSLPPEQKQQWMAQQARLAPDANTKAKMDLTREHYQAEEDIKRTELGIKAYEAETHRMRPGGGVSQERNKPSGAIPNPDSPVGYSFVNPSDSGFAQSMTNGELQSYMRNRKETFSTILAQKRLQDTFDLQSKSGATTEQEKHLANLGKSLKMLLDPKGMGKNLPQAQKDALVESYVTEHMGTYGKNIPDMLPEDKRGFVKRAWDRISASITGKPEQQSKLPIVSDQMPKENFKIRIGQLMKSGMSLSDIRKATEAAGYDTEEFDSITGEIAQELQQHMTSTQTSTQNPMSTVTPTR